MYAGMFVRYAQIAALMPVMQFRLLRGGCCLRRIFRRLRLRWRSKGKMSAGDFQGCRVSVKVTGEPIARSMEFVFPWTGYGEGDGSVYGW